MRTQGEHIRTLQRRVDFLKAREHRNSYDAAELGALEWALVNVPPAQRTWVGLTDKEIEKCYETTGHYQTLRAQDRFAVFALAQAIEAKLKEKNT